MELVRHAANHQSRTEVERTRDGKTVVLSTIRNIFLEKSIALGCVLEEIGRSVAARQLSDYTVTVALWEQLIDSDGYES